MRSESTTPPPRRKRARTVKPEVWLNCRRCRRLYLLLPYRRGVYCSKDCCVEHQKGASDPAERFWAHVEKTASCWIWTAGKSNGGHGQATMNGKQIGSHRLSWELHHGPIPEGLWVLHNCPGGDNPSCVNPAHLWLGTPAENILDRMLKAGVKAHTLVPCRRSALESLLQQISGCQEELHQLRALLGS